MTAVLWSRDAPARCACAGAYRPQLNKRGKLVKTREPAWRMMEQTRDPLCLQERCRSLAKVYPVDYQHHKRSDGSGAGYPDCHFCVPRRPDGGGGSAFAELKRMGEDPTPDQVRWLIRLQDAGHLVYLVRPCCMLVGAVDELLAAFAGVRCLYAGGHPNGRPSLGDVLADMAATDPRAPMLLPTPPSVGSKPARPLPGHEPGEPFGDAVGYVVPMPTTDAASIAVRLVELWLREAGISPNDVPYPMRLVTGEREVLAQVRAGSVRVAGGVLHSMVWRRGTPSRAFPAHLADALRAEVIVGATSDEVVWLIEGTAVRSDQPKEVSR